MSPIDPFLLTGRALEGGSERLVLWLDESPERRVHVEDEEDDPGDREG